MSEAAIQVAELEAQVEAQELKLLERRAQEQAEGGGRPPAELLLDARKRR